MNKWTAIYRSNLHFARNLWDSLPKASAARLKALSKQYSSSLADGDIQLLDGVWYVTHTGLIGIATRRHCLGIKTSVAEKLSDPASSRWSSKQSFTNLLVLAGSLAMATPIPPMSLRSSAGPSCASLRRVPSTVPYERPTASGSAQLMNSEGRHELPAPLKPARMDPAWRE